MLIKYVDVPLALVRLGAVDPRDMPPSTRSGKDDFRGPKADFLARSREWRIHERWRVRRVIPSKKRAPISSAKRAPLPAVTTVPARRARQTYELGARRLLRGAGRCDGM